MASDEKKKAAPRTGKKAGSSSIVPAELIQSRILMIRDRRVLLDSDLAELYGTTTKRLNEQVRRNRDRFPEDFMFRLSQEEFAALRSHLATSNEAPQRGGRRYPPHVFTEHGAIMAANVLNTPRATEAAIFVVRAFIALRDYLASNARLAKKMDVCDQLGGPLTAISRIKKANTYQGQSATISAERALLLFCSFMIS